MKMKLKRLQPIFVEYDVPEYGGIWCFEMDGVAIINGGIFENVRPSQFGDTIGGFAGNINQNLDLFKNTLNFVFTIRELPAQYIEDITDTRRDITWGGREVAKKIFGRFLWDISYIPSSYNDVKNDFIRFLLLNDIYQTPPCWLIMGRPDENYDIPTPSWTYKKR